MYRKFDQIWFDWSNTKARLLHIASKQGAELNLELNLVMCNNINSVHDNCITEIHYRDIIYIAIYLVIIVIYIN